MNTRENKQIFNKEKLPWGLYIVATPIGNLKDITLRALEILKNVDFIACEDTRHTGILLSHYEIKNKLLSYHEYNKITQTPKIIELIKKDKKSVALVSDAGTPGISDPGYYLIREAIKENLPVIPIPGPSAIISALVISGLPSDRFTFEGFLSKRRGRKLKKLKALRDETRTMVFYDSPYRVLDTLKDMLDVFGDRKIAFVRELTKKFETVYRGYISEVITELEKNPPRGEIVLVVSGKESNEDV
ncbi:MAG: 16S rRNA (cytidine(1402)-2'-O)-methyltransferase [candidate division WOR-3 bacterium]|nr:16S rRNA (cytidine(1402)-2'-O)-methyltransferase [candidate division WOR-3 bacterium]